MGARDDASRPLGRLLVDPVDAGLLDVAVAAEGGGEGEHADACGLVLRRRDDAGTAQQILRPRRRESAEEKKSACEGRRGVKPRRRK